VAYCSLCLLACLRLFSSGPVNSSSGARMRFTRPLPLSSRFGLSAIGSNPVPTKRIADDLGRSRDATLTNLERLEAGNYIERSAAVGYAYEYKVQLITG
jgi:biotin operon repressor